MKLTEEDCANATKSLSDGNGLRLQVTPTGSKSWIYKFRMNGKKQTIGLGGYPAVSLAEARIKRDEALALVKRLRS